MDETCGMIEVLAYYGLLDDKGAFNEEIKIRCPFHSDRSPSLSINLSKNVWICFPCGRSGGTIQFVQEYAKLNGLQALFELRKIKREFESGTRQITIYERDEKEREELLEDASNFFYSLSQPSWEDITSHYMLDRGFSRETLRKYDVRINSSSNYPVIIPLLENGEFIGYVMRRLDGEQPKYLFCRGYSRKTGLVGEFHEGILMVVEGIADLMMSTQYGFENTCALLGCHPTKEQIEKIKSYATKVIVALDSDAAGIGGFEELRNAIDLPMARFRFPKGYKDIGELSKSAFIRAINRLRFDY